MRLAASNIAWARGDDARVAELLGELGFQGVEVAPTALWPEPLGVSEAQVQAARREWEQRGLPIVAMQALLFGQPELQIFSSPELRERTFHYLSGMIRLGARLGAGALVFGSPKNRLVGTLPVEQVEAVAVPFFRRLGELARAEGTALCIEPNPSVYGCDFVTTSTQGLALVEQVDSPGFCLHLDAGGMTLSGEPVDAALEARLARSRHFHVSEANLAPIGSGSVDHAAFSRALRHSGYAHWVSVEMRAPAGPEPLGVLRGALSHAARAYMAPG